jgi:hypothetical protein
MANAYPRRPALIRATVANVESSPGEQHANQHVIPLDKPRLYTFIPSGTDTPDSVTVLDVSGGSDGVWRDVPYDDRGTNLTDAAETLYVSGEQWRRLVAGTLTADRTKTLGTTQARAGHSVLITSTESTAYALTIVNGGTAGGTLATMRGPGYLLAFFDGTNWVARSFGGAATVGPNAAAQSTWYVNSSTGSDSAAGASTAPLRTVGELLRRLRGVTVTSATVDVYLTGSFSSESLYWDLTLDSNVYFTVYGVRTSVLTGTLTSGTRNWDSTVPQDGRVIDSALATSWTSSLGANLNSLIKITTAGGAATAWITKDLGSKTARISSPMLSDFSPATIASGNAYTVYTLTPLGADVTFNLRMGHNAYLLINDCEIGTAGALHGVEVTGGNSNFATCAINGLDVYANTSAATLGCKLAHGPRANRGGLLNSYHDLAISTSSPAQCRDGAQLYAFNLTCQGMQYACSGGTSIVGSGGWLAVYDPNVSASGNGVDVLAGATLKSAGRIFGTTSSTGSNSGIFVDACGRVAYNTSAANLLPAISGATNDTKIGGTVKTYAQLPHTDTTNGAAIGGTTFPRG